MLLSYVAAGNSRAANTNYIGSINGIVVDSITKEPLAKVNVSLKNEKRHALTNDNGHFSLNYSKSKPVVLIQAMGYAPLQLDARHGLSDTIFLVPSSTMLEEVVVKPKKEKYSKKNNPALELLEKVKDYYAKHNPRKEPFYSYDKYNKMILALNNVKDEIGKEGALSSVAEYSPVTGKRILNLLIKETASTDIYSDGKYKNVVRGRRDKGLDESLGQDNIRRFMDDILREVDIFGNDITMLQNKFVSPLSRISPDYYKFHLTDTVVIGETVCSEVSFAPHNRESFGFTGRIYVPLNDPNPYIKKIVMRVPNAINLNFVESLYIVQNFVKDDKGNIIKKNDDLTVEFSVIPGTTGLYARKETTYSGISYVDTSDYKKYMSAEGESIVLADADSRDDDFWQEQRAKKLNDAQAAIDSLRENLRKNKLYYWGEKIVSIMEKGYLPTSSKSKFDIGPLNTFFSVNDLEGARFKIGGMTTGNLSKHWFSRAYTAYGLKDKKLKYGGEVEYSFNEKKYHSREFPVNSIRVSYDYNTDQIGQHYLFTNPDNIFLSLKRKEDNLMTYRRLANVKYIMERRSGFSFEVGVRHEIQYATEFLPFKTGEDVSWRNYKQAAMTLQLRYAPGETFYQMASMRLPINMDAPIFMITQEYGPKGFMGSDFSFNKTEISIEKRFWLSAFGYVDMIVKGGKIWSQVPYPALTWANANLSYTIQPESFALMNPLEFATDQYVSWDMTYFINGAIFNRIPYFNKMKLREVVSFKGYYGSLTDKNNPAKNSNLFQFPADANTSLMGHTPYMELSAGIENIFRFLRVDYVWRLTYRSAPNISKGGLRIALHFTF